MSETPLDMSKREDRIALGHLIVGRMCGALADAGRVLAILPEDEYDELIAGERAAAESETVTQTQRETAQMLVDLYATLRRGGQQAQGEPTP